MTNLVGRIKELDAAIARDKTRVAEIETTIGNNAREREALFTGLSEEEKEQFPKPPPPRVPPPSS